MMGALMSALAAVVAATSAATTTDVPPSGPEQAAIHAVSLNIRFDGGNDGDHAWKFRRARVIEFLTKSNADFIGLQEALPSQRSDLTGGLLDYAQIGRSRETSPTEGEATPIFYARSQWSVVPSRTGTFWLSETPSVSGSKDWKSACPRIATWGVFQSRATTRQVLVLNTHFDHVSQHAREEGARVIAEFLSQEAGDLPVIVMGDFNAAATNPARRTLCEGVAGSPTLVDTFAERFPGPEREVGTFHDFRGGTSGSRIDAILVSSAFEVVSATIERTTLDGVHLSDHYPVSARLAWRRDESAKDAAGAPSETAPPPAGAPTVPPSPPLSSPPSQQPKEPSDPPEPSEPGSR